MGQMPEVVQALSVALFEIYGSYPANGFDAPWFGGQGGSGIGQEGAGRCGIAETRSTLVRHIRVMHGLQPHRVGWRDWRSLADWDESG